MSVVRTSTGTLQRSDDEEYSVSGLTQITGADTYFYPLGSGMQEVAGGAIEPSADVLSFMQSGANLSNSDIVALNTLVAALASDTEFQAARSANRVLLHTPCIGADEATRQMHIYHPLGTGQRARAVRADFTGEIAGTVLSVTAAVRGNIVIGQAIFGVGVASGTVITEMGTGLGGTGTYIVSVSQTVASRNMMQEAPAGSIDWSPLGPTNTDGQTWIDHGWGLAGLTRTTAQVMMVADRMNNSQPLNSVLWNASAGAITDRMLLSKSNSPFLRHYCNWSSQGAAIYGQTPRQYQYACISAGYGPNDRVRTSVNGVIVDDPATTTGSRSASGAGLKNFCTLGPAVGAGTEYSTAPTSRVSPAGLMQARCTMVLPFVSDASDAALSTAMMALAEGRRPLSVPALAGRTVHVMSILGQSNAVGYQQRSTLVSSSTTAAILNRASGGDAPLRNLLMWDASAGAVRLAQEPMQHNDGFKGISAAYLGARQYCISHPDEIILLVPSARGSTAFSTNDWNPGDAVYAEAVSRYLASRAALTSAGAIVGMEINYWCQGEGDRIWGGDPNTAIPLYEVAWGTMADAFGVETGQISPSWVAYPVAMNFADNIMTALMNVRALRPQMSVLRTADVTFTTNVTDGEDPVHYNAQAHRDMAVYLPAKISEAESSERTIILQNMFNGSMDGWQGAGASVTQVGSELGINGGTGTGGYSLGFPVVSGVPVVLAITISSASGDVAGVQIGLRRTSSLGSFISNTRTVTATARRQTLYTMITPTATAPDAVVFVRLPATANLRIDSVRVMQ